MLSIDPINNTVFFVRNAKRRVIAIGFSGAGYIKPAAKKYAKDITLCAALAKLTGLAPLWPLAVYGSTISSQGQQHARRLERMKAKLLRRR